MSDKELSDFGICEQITLMRLKAKYPNAKSIEFERHNCFWVETVGFSSWPLLNPITDNALNLELRDEYEVEIDYWMCVVQIRKEGDVIAEVSFTDKKQINRAVLECILESVK